MSSVEGSATEMCLVLLGPPGAGKGTQAKMLAQTLGVPHIASGDLFRYHQRKGTPLGLKAMEYMGQGLLVPDEITIAMVLEQLLNPGAQKGSLLDGFPRNLAQAEALDEALAGRGQEVHRAIFIKVPEEELVRRLTGRLVCSQCQAVYHRENFPTARPGKCDLCGGELDQRQDDTLEALGTRMQVYRDETQPVLDYYCRAGKLVEVDGLGTVVEVGHRLIPSLQV